MILSAQKYFREIQHWIRQFEDVIGAVDGSGSWCGFHTLFGVDKCFIPRIACGQTGFGGVINEGRLEV